MNRMLALIGAVLSCWAAAPATWAARPVVVDQAGGASIELGDAHVDVIVFLTIRQGESFTGVVTGQPGDPVRVRLLIPDQLPESKLEAADLPGVSVLGVPIDGTVIVGDRTTGDRIRETSTGIRLVSIVDTAGEDDAPQMGGDGTLELRVNSVASDARVALVIGPDDEIVIPDTSRQPRTVARIRHWYATAPDGSRSTSGDSPDTMSRAWLAVPTAVVFAMLGLTIWWMLLGSNIGRRRGVERAARQREAVDLQQQDEKDARSDSDRNSSGPGGA